MRRRTLTILLLIGLIAAAVWLTGPWVGRQFAIDRCQDGGGRWDRARNVCEK